jgi:hypothetical protein
MSDNVLSNLADNERKLQAWLVECGGEPLPDSIFRRAMAEVERLQALFIHMRAAWFSCHLQSWPSEREWVDEEHETARRKANAALLLQFDQQTQEILSGKERNLTPLCAAEMAEVKDE